MSDEPKTALDRQLEQKRLRTGGTKVSMKAEDLHHGVAVSWLAEVFGMDPRSVRARLAGCPVLNVTPQGNRYSLPVAAQYLIKPKIDLNKYLKKMRPDELPSHLQDQFWSAQLKRQKHEENAGDLWRTSKVMDVFAEVFQVIKSTVMLWTEDVERAHGLTPEQRQTIVQLTDALQNELHEKLCSGIGSKVESAKEEIKTGDDPFQPVGLVEDEEEDLI